MPDEVAKAVIKPICFQRRKQREAAACLRVTQASGWQGQALTRSPRESRGQAGYPGACPWGRAGSTGSDTDAAPCLPVHSAWHMSACPRVATAPSTLQLWCPRPPNQTQCSLTASPTRSTWQSSKPRLPVPRTFTPLCWTAPTRSRARRLHHLQALGAPCELAGLGVGQAAAWGGRGEADREGMKSDPQSSLVSAFSSRLSPVAGAGRGQQRPSGSVQGGAWPLLAACSPPA